MIEQIKRYQASEHFRIRLIQSKKFKTDLMGLFLLRPLTDPEASQLALVSRLITRGFGDLPDARSISHRLDEMYGAVLSTDVIKYGELVAMHVKLQFPNHRIVGQKNLFEEALALARDALYDVRHEDGRFLDDYFEQEKQKLIEEIESRVNDKMTYAVDRCIETMCAEEPFSVYHYGSVETVRALTNEQVYAYYREILSSSPLDVLVIGDVEDEEIPEKIAGAIPFAPPKTGFGLTEDNGHPVDQVKEVTETMKVQQGKLTLGYRTHIGLHDPLYEASVLFATILGSGGNSLLFRHVRERESLCYYIFSKIEKFKSIMLVTSGIDIEQYDRVKQMVIHEVEEMQRGAFTDEDIQVAKEAIITSVKSLRDYPNSFINFYFSRELGNQPYDESRIIDEVMAVTRDEIIAAGKRFELDTVHFIKGEETHGTDPHS